MDLFTTIDLSFSLPFFPITPLRVSISERVDMKTTIGAPLELMELQKFLQQLHFQFPVMWSSISGFPYFLRDPVS